MYVWRCGGDGQAKPPSHQGTCACTVNDFEKQLWCIFFFFEWERSAGLFYTVDNLGSCFCYLSGCCFFFFHLEIVCKTFVLFPSPISHPRNTQLILLVENSIQSRPSFSFSLPPSLLPSLLFPAFFSSSNIFWMRAVWQALGSLQRNKNHQK